MKDDSGTGNVVRSAALAALVHRSGLTADEAMKGKRRGGGRRRRRSGDAGGVGLGRHDTVAALCGAGGKLWDR